MEAKNFEQRRYNRVKKYYDTCSRNVMYSTIMIDLIMVILPVMMIIHVMVLMDIHPGHHEFLMYVISLPILTIAVNFIAHFIAIKGHRNEVSWAENELSLMNEVIDDNPDEHSDNLDTAISVLNYLSYGLFLLSMGGFIAII